MTEPSSVAVPLEAVRAHGLPAPRTRLFGRDADIERICRLLDTSCPVTITGPGGIGKTRVAIEVARRQRRRVVFVPLADIDCTAVAATIITACAANGPGPLPGPHGAGGRAVRPTAAPFPGQAILELPAIGAPSGDSVAELRSGSLTSGVLPSGAPPASALTSAARQAGGLPSEGTRWADQAAGLPNEPTVLVLDTFEHMTAAAGLIGELLSALPALMILVTSRRPIGLRDEQVVALDGLDVTADGPATALFRDRARMAGVRRPPPPIADDAAVLELCDLLGGVPLAIELAAARTALMHPAALLAQLRRPGNRRVLGLLARGAVDLPSRQVSMRATMSWSYQLLDGAQQTLFRRLGVFPGSFALETAEQVCTGVGTDDGWVEPDAVLNGIAALVDLHLLEPVTPSAACNADQARFALPDASRAFAVELLEMSGETTAVEERLHLWCVQFGDEAGAGLTSTDEVGWLDRVAEELPAVRHTLTAFAAAGESIRGMSLAVALGSYWAVRGPMAEGLRWLDTFIEIDRLAARLPAQDLAIGVGWANRLAPRATPRLDIDSARSARRMVLAHPHTPALWLSAGDHLVRALVNAGERAEARAIVDEAIRVARDADDRFWLSEFLYRRAQLEWMTGARSAAVDSARAGGDVHHHPLAYAQEALAVAVRCGHRRIAARSQVLAAACLVAARDPADARATVLTALRSLRDIGDQRGVVIAMSVLAVIEMDSGSTLASAAVLRDAINQARQIGFDGAELHCCVVTAMLACRIGRPADAIELDDAMAHPDGVPPGQLPPVLIAAYTAAIARARAAAGAGAAPAEGRGWGWLRARSLELAGQIAATPHPYGTGPRQGGPADAPPAGDRPGSTAVFVSPLGGAPLGSASLGGASLGVPPTAGVPIADASITGRPLTGGPLTGGQAAGAAEQTAPAQGAPLQGRRNAGPQLTARELQILAAIASGRTNAQIAADLFLSAKTVMHHSTSIYRKLGVGGRAEAVALAYRTGLLESPPHG